jgi:hypothetical protein
MRTHRFSSLLVLLLTLSLAGACGAAKSWSVASSENTPPAGVKTAANRGDVRTKVYRDPDGDFAVNIPEDWRVEREEKKNGAYMTTIRPDPNRAANLSILTDKAAPTETDSAELRSFMLTEGSKPFFRGWVEGLREQARVEGRGVVEPTRLDDTNALRMDITYYRNDADDPRQGRGIYLIGDKTTFFISMTANRSRFGELEEIVNTLRVEP